MFRKILSGSVSPRRASERKQADEEKAHTDSHADRRFGGFPSLSPSAMNETIESTMEQEEGEEVEIKRASSPLPKTEHPYNQQERNKEEMGFSSSEEDEEEATPYIMNLDTGQREKITMNEWLGVTSALNNDGESSDDEEVGGGIEEDSLDGGEVPPEKKPPLTLQQRCALSILKSFLVRKRERMLLRGLQRLETAILIENETQHLAEQLYCKTTMCETLLQENVALRVEHEHDQEAALQATRAIAEAKRQVKDMTSPTKPSSEEQVPAQDAATPPPVPSSSKTCKEADKEERVETLNNNDGSAGQQGSQQLGQGLFSKEQIIQLLREKGVDPAQVFGGDGVQADKVITLAEDPTYGPFFKMLAVKVPRMAVENKMRSKGLDPSILDRDPNSPSPNQPPSAKDTLHGESAPIEASSAKMKDHKDYGPFFKMLSVGVPRPAVEIKLKQKDLDPKYLDLDPEAPVPEELQSSKPTQANTDGATKLKDDERYGKYFKMLAVKVPRPAVVNKMVQEGLDPNVLDMDPEGPAPVAKEEPKQNGAVVLLKDDEEYGPFFKMLSVGVPRGAVEAKMKQKGLDVSFLDKGPDAPAPAKAATTTSTSAAAPPASMKLSEHPDYAPFLKMLAVKVPRPAVEAKMNLKGLDPKYLDMDPETTMIPLNKPDQGATEQQSQNVVKLKDDERYGPFLKMLAVKVPRGAVEAKMRAKGLDPKYLDMDPESPAPPKEGGAQSGAKAQVKMVKLKDDERYAPFLKMIEVKVPRGAVEAKMKLKGLDPKYLDMDPESLIPAAGADNKPQGPVVKLKDDERYGPFLKMLAVKVPRGAVEAKMRAKGLDPKYLDMDPESPAPPKEQSNSASSAAPAKPKVPEKKPDKIVRRKLHWRKIMSNTLEKVENAIWNKCQVFVFEQREIKELNFFFTVNISEQERQKAKEKAEKAKTEGEGGGPEKKVKKPKEEKKQLLETQRSNNIAIILSRMKGLGVDSQVIRKCLYSLDIPEEVNGEDVRSVLSLTPTPEEEKLLQAYDGDREMVGKAEYYFFELMAVPRYKQRIKCLWYKMKFDESFEDAQVDFEVLNRACKQVLDSKKLRRLLEIILALGNFMNEGPDAPRNRIAQGFHLDALAKLRQVKSFATTPSTTALHYLVLLIQTRERDILSFIKSDTDPIREAANVSLTNAVTQLQQLEAGIKVLELEHKYWGGVVADEEKRAAMTENDKVFVLGLNKFYKHAQSSLNDLRSLSDETEGLFKQTIEYFCEDASTTSEVLFRTLQGFFADFELALNQNDAARQSAMKRQRSRLQQDKKKSSGNSGTNTASGKKKPSASGVGDKKDGRKRAGSGSTTKPSSSKQTTKPALASS